MLRLVFDADTAHIALTLKFLDARLQSDDALPVTTSFVSANRPHVL